MQENVGMGIGGSEIPASMFQAANPIFILLFGLVFTATWSYLAARGLEPDTPLKFALGLAQLALGFVAIWYGAQYAANNRGIVSVSWLLLGVLFQTTGELCSSPIGLSMVTKLSPKHLVSTVMGAWFVGMGLANTLIGSHRQIYGFEWRRRWRTAGNSATDRHGAYLWKGLWADCGRGICYRGRLSGAFAAIDAVDAPRGRAELDKLCFDMTGTTFRFLDTHQKPSLIGAYTAERIAGAFRNKRPRSRLGSPQSICSRGFRCVR